MIKGTNIVVVRHELRGRGKIRKLLLFATLSSLDFMLKVNREPMKDGEVTKFNFCLISILGRTLDNTGEFI